MSRNPNDTQTGDKTMSSSQNPTAPQSQPRAMQSPTVAPGPQIVQGPIAEQHASEYPGAEEAAVVGPGVQSPKTQTRERAVGAPDNASRTEIPVPVLPEPVTAESGFARPTGMTLAELAQSDDADQPETQGYGPRIVVLGNIVTGPGTSGSPLQRGNVRFLSELLGDAIMKDRKAVTRHLKRYLDNHAIREANEEEAKYTQVTFVEGEEALATNLVDETQKRIAAEGEAQRLNAILNMIDQNPNLSPSAAAALVDRGEQPSTANRA